MDHNVFFEDLAEIQTPQFCVFWSKKSLRVIFQFMIQFFICLQSFFIYT